MPWVETGGLADLTSGIGAITTIAAVPVSIVISIAALVGICRARIDAYVAGALDRFLATDAKRLREREGRMLLDFRTSDSVRAMAAGLGFGRIRVCRTIVKSMRNGYRVRLRAFAEGARGRTIVRMLDVDLRGKK